MALMFVGISFLSLLTAAIASRFVKDDRSEEHQRARRDAAADRGGRGGAEGRASQLVRLTRQNRSSRSAQGRVSSAYCWPHGRG